MGAIPNLRTIGINGVDASRPLAVYDRVPSALTPSASSITLHVSGLTVEMGGRLILRDLSFDAAGGQVMAVVGRNGVGKTTLLRSLAGLQPFTGSALVNGQPPDLGLVFQNADLQLFNATARDEILYGLPEPDPIRYSWLLQILGLNGYEDTPPLLLSEGEKKRVALATILMRGPRHGLLLDEPALGQDAVHKDRLVHLARALAEAGQLVIMTTHDLTLAAQADRLLILGPDGLVADGPPDLVFGDAAPWSRIGMSVPVWVQPKNAKCVDDRCGQKAVGEAMRP
jgi:energy-coupling factor transporter ATP-binding protein EcfA2